MLGRSLSVLALSAFVAACSSTNDPSPAVGDAGVDAPSTDVTLTMNLTIAPGAETHRCQLVQLPGNRELWVSGLEHHYTKGSHHFLMYATTLKSIPAIVDAPARPMNRCVSARRCAMSSK